MSVKMVKATKEELILPENIMPVALSSEEKKETKENIKRIVNDLAMSKIQLIFELFKVDYYSLWEEWGYNSMKEYCDEIKLFTTKTCTRWIRLAREALKHGYNWERLENIPIYKLDMIFKVPPSAEKHIPDLIDLARDGSVQQINEAIKVLNRKNAGDEDTTRLIFDLPESLFPLWEQTVEKVNREAGTTRKIPREAVLELLMANYLS